jgi:hypothetical protein
MARHVLGGPTDAGRATYQIALTVCDACGRGWQQGRGERVEVGPEIVKMACCDAQHLGRIPSPAGAAPHGDHDVFHVGGSVKGESHVGGSAKGESHVGDSAKGGNAKSDTRMSTPPPIARAKRARQDVPPAVRREVMRRDGGRCVVPGCKNASFLDIHHLVLRSEGGEHDPDAMIVLCSAHHRAEHRGQLLIEGRVSTGLVFRHGDSAQYGAVVNPRIADAHAQAFRALRALGFRESEAHQALARVRATTPVGNTSTEQVLRARSLCSRHWQRQLDRLTTTAMEERGTISQKSTNTR